MPKEAVDLVNKLL